MKEQLEKEQLEKSKMQPNKRKMVNVDDWSESDWEAEELLAKQLRKDDSSGNEVDLDGISDPCSDDDQMKIGFYVFCAVCWLRQKCHYVGVVSGTDSCDSMVSFFKTIKYVR